MVTVEWLLARLMEKASPRTEGLAEQVSLPQEDREAREALLGILTEAYRRGVGDTRDVFLSKAVNPERML